MTPASHFSKFTSALDSIRRAISIAKNVNLFKAAAQFMSMAQRFYLPNSRDILGGKPLDDPLKELVRLPYDVIAVLSECTFSGDGRESTSSWMITLAFDPKGPANQQIGLIDPATIAGRSIGLLSLVPSSVPNYPWSLYPVVLAIVFPNAGSGFDLQAVAEKGVIDEMQRVSPLGVFGEFNDDVLSVVNLCAILNLANVSTRVVSPPERLNKKRQRTGKLPLFDYHVLEVDGDRWDSPYVATGEGTGFRSHLRRGHIRRLAGKHVWVRAAFVHGAIAGFVDKDYDVRA